MSDVLREKYVGTLITLLGSAGHSNGDLTALMDRIERLLGLSEPAQIMHPSFMEAVEAVIRHSAVGAGIQANLIAAVEMAELAAVSEGRPNIPVSIPPEYSSAVPTQETGHFISAPPTEAEALAEMGPAIERMARMATRAADPVELTEQGSIDASVDTHSPSTAEKPTSTNDATEPWPGYSPLPAPGRATERVDAPARVLGATETCEPGCGRLFPAGSLGRHRAGCPEWLAYRAVHVHDVTDANWPKPRPTDDGPEREAAFVARRAQAAGAKVDQTWAARHPDEGRPLAPRQVEYLDAVRAADGNFSEATRALGLKNTGAISGLITQLRAEGRLPADVDLLIEARKAASFAASASRAGAKA